MLIGNFMKTTLHGQWEIHRYIRISLPMLPNMLTMAKPNRRKNLPIISMSTTKGWE